MKQLSTILFLSLSLIIQYNKQWNYMQCRIANTFKFTETKCDCEKASEQKDNAESLPVSSFLHFHLDELYDAGASQTTATVFLVVLKKKAAYSETGCKGYSGNPYHPPRC